MEQLEIVMMPAPTKERELQIRELKPGWLKIIEDSYISKGYMPCTVWPDETIVMLGTDTEFNAVVQKHGLNAE